MPDDVDFKRFSQRVRSEIRQGVVRHREAPPLALWVSHGPDPRRIARVRVGQASSQAEVRANIREAVLEAGASWCALGRLLMDTQADAEVGSPFTTLYGLMCADADLGVRSWAVEIRAGKCGAWVEAGNEDPSLVELLTGCLRAVQREEAMDDGA